MNLNNIAELLEYGLEIEGTDFEEWYAEELDNDIRVIKHPFVSLNDVTELLDKIEHIKESHIYWNYLILLKDYLNES